MSLFKTFILGYLVNVAHGQTVFKPTSKADLLNKITSCINESADGDCTNIAATDGAIGNWDTSDITNMRLLFENKAAFNQPLNWDTSKVTDMSGMFSGCVAFNQPVNFDTSQVTSFNGMFYGNSAFNQEINFDTSSATQMSQTLRGTTVFNQPLTFTDTSNVENFSLLFSGAKAFNQPLTFDTSSVTDMERMFKDAESFNQPVNFDTKKVTKMNFMFQNAKAFNQPVNFDTSKVVGVERMFNGASAFNQEINFDTSVISDYRNVFDGSGFSRTLCGGSWDFQGSSGRAGCCPAGKYMSDPFVAFSEANSCADCTETGKSTFQDNSQSSCNVFKAYDKNHLILARDLCLNESADGDCTDIAAKYGAIGDWDTSLVTDMGFMFSGATEFNQPIGAWDTSQVTDMESMFQNAKAFNQPIGAWDTSNVVGMKYMFFGALAFNQPLNWDTSSVTIMTGMFNTAYAFNSELGLEFMQGLRTIATANISTMFKYAKKFRRTLCLSAHDSMFLDTGRQSDDWFVITGNDPNAAPETWPERYFDLGGSGCCPPNTYMINQEYTALRGPFDAATDCAACSTITEANSQATCPAAPCTVADMDDCSAADLEDIKQKYNERSSTAQSGTTCTKDNMSGCSNDQLVSIKAKYVARQESCSS